MPTCEICGQHFGVGKGGVTGSPYCRECRRLMAAEKRAQFAQKMTQHTLRETVCPVCGQVFLTSKSGRPMCETCREIAAVPIRPHRPQLEDTPRGELTSQEKASLIAKEAREHGMSYGKYVAETEGR